MSDIVTFFVLNDEHYGDTSICSRWPEGTVNDWADIFNQWSTAEMSADDIKADYLDKFVEVSLFPDGQFMIQGQRNPDIDTVVNYATNGRDDTSFDDVDAWLSKFAQ